MPSTTKAGAGEDLNQLTPFIAEKRCFLKVVNSFALNLYFFKMAGIFLLQKYILLNLVQVSQLSDTHLISCSSLCLFIFAL